MNKLTQSVVGKRILTKSSLLSQSSSCVFSTKRYFSSCTFNNSNTTTPQEKPTTAVETTTPEETTTLSSATPTNTEQKATLASGKAYNGIPLHTPPQHIKKLSFLGALLRYVQFFKKPSEWTDKTEILRLLLATAISRWTHLIPSDLRS